MVSTGNASISACVAPRGRLNRESRSSKALLVVSIVVNWKNGSVPVFPEAEDPQDQPILRRKAHPLGSGRTPDPVHLRNRRQRRGQNHPGELHHGRRNHEKRRHRIRRRRGTDKKENRRPITPRHRLRNPGQADILPADRGREPPHRPGRAQRRQLENPRAGV